MNHGGCGFDGPLFSESEPVKIRHNIITGGNMIVNEQGYICCPKCGMKTKTKVLPQTVLHQFPLFCTWCKRQTIIDYNPTQARA